MKKTVLILLCMIGMLSCAKAQTGEFYRREIGGGIGATNYMGDFNESLTKGYQPSFSLIYRKNISPWQALRIDAQYGKLKGSSKDVKTYYPDYVDDKYDFSRSLFDLNVCYEYNFWPYGTGNDYRGAKRLTPFVFGGLGATLASGGEPKAAFTANVPIGLGVKYKINDRTNLGVEWAMHFSMSDKLDGVTDPYKVSSSGLFKNTDCYGTLRVTLTYSFSAKCPTCNKDDY